MQVRQTASGYGPEGELVSQTGDTETASFQYDAAARLFKLIDGNQAATTYRYTPAGYLASIVSPKGDTIQTQINAQVPMAPNFSGLTTFQLDGQDQLLKEQSLRTPNYTEAFGYDPAGNPTLFKGSAPTYDADNQVSQNPAYGFDGNGNPTFYQNVPLDFDPENHLAQVNQSAPGAIVSHGYTGDGLRAWKQAGTNPSSRVCFLYDGSQPVLELDSTGAVIKAANTFGANGLLSRRVSASSTFYTFDPQGSVCQRFGSAGTPLSSDEYDAYGALLAQSPSGVGDVFGFGAQYGYYTDPEDGLVLLTNRYYDPGTGRFLNRGPLGQAGGANQYGYAGNNPGTYADPLGRTREAPQMPEIQSVEHVSVGGGYDISVIAGYAKIWVALTASERRETVCFWSSNGDGSVTPVSPEEVAQSVRERLCAWKAGQVDGYHIPNLILQPHFAPDRDCTLSPRRWTWRLCSRDFSRPARCAAVY